jgi:hypothetical protein
MANLVIDNSRLSSLLEGTFPVPAADRLYRDRSVFFVGGVLPVYETLETMFDSFCTEATALFYLTFGPAETFPRGEEMARQIKKNFNVRLMARLDRDADAPLLERTYAAGVDNVDLHLAEPAGAAWGERLVLPPVLRAARELFPRWGVAATLHVGDEAPTVVMSRIDTLLAEGVVPLVRLLPRVAGSAPGGLEMLFEHLEAGWKRNSVPMATYLPLLSATTPLVATKPAGLFQGIVDRFRDRRQLAESDIRRHLRVRPTEDSLDSAVL